MRANRGFTRIQLTVALGVIVILCAILTPLITGYINEARTTGANEDVRAIARAYQLHKRDTGQFPIYADSEASESDTPAATYLIGPGTLPKIGTSGFALRSTADLEEHLNTNKLHLATADSASSTLAYRGPYVEAITADPWGNAFVVAADNATRRSTNIGYVISAGPNGILETARNQMGALTLSGDDLAAPFN